MSLGKGCNLRQVGDAEDLAAQGNRLKFFSDHLGNGPADAYIHLVKDQRGHAVPVRYPCLDGQHDTGKLSAGSNPSQGAYALADVRLELKLRPVHPVVVQPQPPAFTLHDPAGIFIRLKLDVKPDLLHAQTPQLLLDGPTETLRRFPALVRKLQHRSGDAGAARLDLP